MRASLITFLCLLATDDVLAADASSEPAAPVSKARAEGRPRLFIYCPQGCHEEYLRQKLSYFDVVRDRRQADLQLFIVVQMVANGGVRFTVRVLEPTVPVPARDAPPSGEWERGAESRNTRAPSLKDQSLGEPIVRHVDLPPGIPPAEQRRLLEQAVYGALYLALSTTEHAPAFEFALKQRDGVTLSQLDDPWDYWVFTPQIWADTVAETRSTTGYLELGFSARRTTELHKIWAHAEYGHHFSRYVLEDGETSQGTVSRWLIQSFYARSLGKHWAAGPLVTAERDTYQNLNVHVHYGPALEYNFFPYSENATALLSLTYQTGLWVNWYDEVTQFGKLRELRPYHALSLVGDINQPWGSIQLGTQANSFLDQPEQFRLRGLAGVSLQLHEGLALNINAEGAWIRDQISLRVEDVSDEEILLGTVQLPSNFQLFAEVGFSYTFGSIHNTIINPRFGRVADF